MPDDFEDQIDGEETPPTEEISEDGEDLDVLGEDGEAAEEDESEVEAQPEKPLSRAEKRFQTLSRTAREASERATRAEQEAAALRRQFEQTQARSQQDDPEREAARLALMTPEERLEYKLDLAERRNQQNVQTLQAQMMDQSDRAGYLAKAAADPRYAKYANEVEERLGRMRAQGQNVPREALLFFIIGENAVKNGAKSTAKAKQAAALGAKRQVASPTNGKGDTAPQRGKTGDTPAKRLENMFI